MLKQTKCCFVFVVFVFLSSKLYLWAPHITNVHINTHVHARIQSQYCFDLYFCFAKCTCGRRRCRAAAAAEHAGGALRHEEVTASLRLRQYALTDTRGKNACIDTLCQPLAGADAFLCARVLCEEMAAFLLRG